MIVFFAIPIALLAVYSLGSWNIVTFEVTFGWTLESYDRLRDPIYLEAIGRSLAISVGSTLICLVVGFPLAYSISRQPGRRQAVLLLALMVPFWVSFVVRTYGIVNLLSPGGWVTEALEAVGIVSSGTTLLYTPGAVVAGIVYTYLPLMVLPLYVAMQRIDPALIAAAADLGASGLGTFRRVVVPLSAPGIVAGCVLVGVPATGEYVIPAILGGDKTLVYGNVVADQFLRVGDYPFGSAIAVTLMAVVTVALLAARLVAPRWADAG